MTHRRSSEKLQCPHCGGLHSLVRPYHMTAEQQQTGKYWRQRACESCGGLFATSETVEPLPSSATSCDDRC